MAASPPTSGPMSWQGLKGVFGYGNNFPGVAHMTMHIAYHKLERMMEDEDEEGCQKGASAGHETDGGDCHDIEEQLERVVALLNLIIDAEVKRQKHNQNAPTSGPNNLRIENGFSDAVNASDYGEALSSNAATGGENTCGATTESDAPGGQMFSGHGGSGVILGDDGCCSKKGDGHAAANLHSRGSSTKVDASLSSLTPFILSVAFECPFLDIREAFRGVLKRMRDDLGWGIPSFERSDSDAVGPWFKTLGHIAQRDIEVKDIPTTFNKTKEREGFMTRARYFVENGECPSYLRALFSHWGELSDAHAATVQKLLYADEGPLPLFDRLVCALMASSAHNAECLTRYLCAIMLRGGSFHRTAGVTPTSEKKESTALNDGKGKGSGGGVGGGKQSSGAKNSSLRDSTIQLLLSKAWPEKYSVIRRVCAILARQPWTLKRSDLNPLLNHWSEPELIHMFTILSYFLGVSSLLTTLKVPCDYSTSYEVAMLLAQQAQSSSAPDGRKVNHDGTSPKAGRRKESEDDDSDYDVSSMDEEDEESDEEVSESGAEERALRDVASAAAQSGSWMSSEPLLSRLVDGVDNLDIIYHKRITRTGGPDGTLTTAMFSFEEGARFMLDTFFPTAAEDLADEFAILSAILSGESVTQRKQTIHNSETRNAGVPQLSPLIRVSDTLKLVPVNPSKVGNSSPPKMEGGEYFASACTAPPPQPAPPPAPQELRALEVDDTTFWEAVRSYSLNVAGVINLSYNYCDINLNVGKLAKTFALTATMQPESDPTELPYGDPMISPRTYDEEECILALGLCAMHAKIEALLLRGLSSAR